MPKKHPTKSPTALLPLPVQLIERRIFAIRGQKVMIDSDLADLYEVPTKAMNQAVRRNLQRFPDDFMIQLTPKEAESLRSQFVTSNEGRGGRRYLPYAFTEQGVAMLSSVLSSERAVQVNIAIIRVFVKLREILASHKDLLQRVEALERSHKEQGFKVDNIFAAIKKLIEAPSEPPKRRIGFTTDRDE